MSTLLGNYVTPVPAQQRVGKHWYLGSADAIFQSLNLINDEKPDIVVVVGADHVYRMDFSQMVDAARRVGAGVHGGRDPAADRAGRPVRRDRRGPRGPVTDPRRSWRSRRIPVGLPGQPRTRCSPRWATTSSTPTPCVDAVTDDAVMSGSAHDMGGDIVPAFVSRNEAGRLRLQGQRGARRHRPRPRLLARRRDAGLLLRRAHGPDRAAAGVQPLQLRVADLHLLRPAAAGQAGRAARAACCRPPRTPCSSPGGRRDRRPRLPLGALPGGVGRSPTPR